MLTIQLITSLFNARLIGRPQGEVEREIRKKSEETKSCVKQEVKESRYAWMW